MAKVIFASALRMYTHDVKSCEIDGGTVKDVLLQIGGDFPDLKPRLFKEGVDGTLRHLIVISVDGKDIRLLEREQTCVSRESVIRLLIGRIYTY